MHVRLFMFVVEEPGRLLRNVVRMLSMYARPIHRCVACCCGQEGLLVGFAAGLGICVYICLVGLMQPLFSPPEPSGHLQWDEYDNETFRLIKSPPSAPSPAFDALFQKFASLSPKTKPLSVLPSPPPPPRGLSPKTEYPNPLHTLNPAGSKPSTATSNTTALSTCACSARGRTGSACRA